ncbi:flagellar assembly protein FliX [Hansschlegelia sp. KR7-227]|uniref:flagellar assembly protein FliX n=1 Tax=Hansschlegelia sp. KR7-227 TaxID=3400914 RepID=UPI003C037A92
MLDVRGNRMRVDGLGRAVFVSGGGARTMTSGGDFRLSDSASATAARTTSSVRAAPPLDALIALQALAEDSTSRRKRAIRRGRGLLEALDGLKLALISGEAAGVPIAALSKSFGGQRDPTGDVGLDDTLAAIELRVAVELAKRGR